MANAWRITCYEGRSVAGEYQVPGVVSDGAIRELLSRLQAGHLSDEQIVSASLPEGVPGRLNLLDAHPRIDGLAAYRTEGWSHYLAQRDGDAP